VNAVAKILPLPACPDTRAAFDAVVERLRRAKTLMLATHVGPDGDGLGSEIGLLHALEAMGKKVWVVNAEPVPAMYRFLPDWQRLGIQGCGDLPDQVDVMVVVDCGDSDRLGDAWHLRDRASSVVNIDHHVTNERFGDLNLVLPEACAVGEIVYDLLQALRAPLKRESALGLYTSITTDTGSFKYTNTTARTFRIAAHLVDLGVEPWPVALEVFETASQGKMALTGDVLAHTRLVGATQQVAMALIPFDMFVKTGTTKDDVEGLIDLMRRIDTVEVAALAREEEPGRWKVSLRAKRRADVSKVAENFDGGGHPFAAGFNIVGNAERWLEKLEQALVEATQGGH